MTLLWKHVNYLFLLATLAGMVLFFMAPTLCRNTFFHYTTGEIKRINKVDNSPIGIILLQGSASVCFFLFFFSLSLCSASSSNRYFLG